MEILNSYKLSFVDQAVYRNTQRNDLDKSNLSNKLGMLFDKALLTLVNTFSKNKIVDRKNKIEEKIKKLTPVLKRLAISQQEEVISNIFKNNLSKDEQLLYGLQLLQSSLSTGNVIVIPKA